MMTRPFTKFCSKFCMWIKSFLKGFRMFPTELQPLLDTAEASLTASDTANAALDAANAALTSAQATADAAAHAAQAAHLQSVADAQALIEGMKTHFHLS
jgi:hypothetical protein